MNSPTAWAWELGIDKKGLADAAVAALSADRRLVWGHCRVYDILVVYELYMDYSYSY